MRDDKTRQAAPARARGVSAIALEQRMLLDGAAVATAVDQLDDGGGDQVVDQMAPVADSLQGAGGKSHAVFIDKSVKNYGQLLAGIPQDAEVFFIEAGQDGLAQMVAALAGGQQQYDSIQVFSHGSRSGILLGSTTLDFGNVDDHAGLLGVIGSSLTSDGDLLFFGCDVAETQQGKALVDRIAELTGADVAASTDTTGGLATGGDWDLEYTAGSVETAAVIDRSVLDAFSSKLLTGWTSHGFSYMLNSDNANNDEFGWSTAISDNTGMIAVGGWAQGDIYVYRPTGGGEYEEYKISPPTMGYAGSAVDIDGNFLIIGYGSIDKAYIYQFNTGTNSWDLRANLTGTAGSNFGCDVAISVVDGGFFRAAVGAKLRNTGVVGQGGVHLYNSTDGVTWVARSILSTNDGRFDGELNFGTSVALDGNKLVVGAPGHGYETWKSSSGADGTAAQRHYIGRAYVYDWTSGNTLDIQDTGIDAYLQADGGYYNGFNANPYFVNTEPNAQQNFRFGTSVDISYNGTNYLVAVGSPDEANFGTGEAYVFTNPGGGATPAPTANVFDGTNPAGSKFGESVGIDAYTGTLVVGARNVAGTDDGQVFAFKQSSAWAQVSEWTGPVDTRFGWSVAVARDTVIIGSSWGVGAAGNRAGALNMYINNSAPVATNDTLSINEGQVSTPINVLVNDTDPNYAGTAGFVGTATGGVDVPKLVFLDEISAGYAYIETDALGYGRIVFDASTDDLKYLQVGQSLVIPIYYTIVDAGGESTVGTLTVTVNGVNNAPTAGDAIALQVVNNGVTNYLFTNGTNPMSPQRLKDAGYFIDPDTTETHNYKFTNGLQTYTPAGGPTFTINATTGEVTVTGITGAMVGTTYNVLGIRVTDSQGAILNMATWQCRVDRANTGPTPVGGALPVTAYEDNIKPGSYSQTGNTVTVTSTAHGLQVGDVVFLDYLDGAGSDASYTVATVVNANTFTVVDGTSQSTSGVLMHTVKGSVDMSVHFTDANFPTEELTYSLIGAPSWVTISPVTGELTINGGNGDIPDSPAVFTVRVTDMYLQTADKQVTITLTPVNDAPALTNSIPFTSAYLGNSYTTGSPIVTVPADLFTDIDLMTPNTFTVKAYVGATEITTGAGSPSWLRYDSVTRTFYTSGNVTGQINDIITVRMVATDTGTPPMTSEYTFDINLFAPPRDGAQVYAAGANNAAGAAVAVSEDGLWMAVGEPEYTNGANYQQGQVSIYRWTGAAWQFAQTIASPSVAADGRFGYSLDISNNGERLVVGAPGVSGAGRVYTFQRTAGASTFGGTATATYAQGDANTGDMFGFSVALNRDGSKFVAGAPGDDAAGVEAGAVYLFDWNNTTQIAKRLPVVDTGEAVNAQHYDRFGWSVAFDGNVVVVGAPFDSVAGTLQYQGNGSATVLGVTAGVAGSFNGAVIKGAGAASYDMFGWSVSVDAFRAAGGDAANSSVVVAVGAPGSDAKASDAGAVHVYRWAGISDTVSQAQLNTVIVAPVLTAFDGQAFHGFGSSVAVDAQNTAGSFANDVKDNGLRLAVGSKLNGDYGGTAYLFRAKTDWNWFGQAYNQVSSISTKATGNQFGWAVSISNDATSAWNAGYAVAANAGRIAIGAPGTDNTATSEWGRRGSVHWDSSAGDRIETAPGLLSADASKVLAQDETAGDPIVVPQVPGSDGKTGVPVSGGRYSWVDLAAGSSVITTVTVADVPPVTLTVVTPQDTATSLSALPADDPLLFLLQIDRANPAGDVAPATDADAPGTPDEEKGEKVAAKVEPAVAATSLSRQLQALGERNTRASIDLLERLGRMHA